MIFTVVAASGIISLAIIKPGVAPGSAEIYALFVLAIALTGVFSCHTRETFVRRNYHSIQILKDEKIRSELLASQAIEANQSKSRFLAMMSHELRTPLNAVIGFSDTMRQGVFGQIESPRYRSYLEDIYSSGQHLLHLVDQLLDLTKAEEGKIKIVRVVVDLDDMLGELSRGFALLAESRGLNFVSEPQTPNLSIYADRDLLRQMVSNILSNAMKFTVKGGQIRLRWGQDASGAIAISVIDTGIGISAADIPRALDLFGQIDGRLNRKYGGIGIGLHLAKRLAEVHGGELTIASEVDKGTTVTLIFPATAKILENPTQSMPLNETARLENLEATNTISWDRAAD